MTIRQQHDATVMLNQWPATVRFEHALQGGPRRWRWFGRHALAEQAVHGLERARKQDAAAIATLSGRTRRRHEHDVARVKRLQRQISERDEGGLEHYAARRRREPASTGFVDRAVNDIPADRTGKKSVRWSGATMRPFLDMRTVMLNHARKAPSVIAASASAPHTATG